MFPAQIKNFGKSLLPPDLEDIRKSLLLGALLVVCSACALVQPKATQEVYYTIPSVTYFRDSPGYASRNTATVYRGEQVLILSRLPDDWCRVQSVQGREIGWIQCPLLSPVPIPAATYTIQANEVPLRDVPQTEGASRQALQRGDRIRKLSENQQGWWWVLVEKNESLGWLPDTVVNKLAPDTAVAGQATAPSESNATGLNAASPAAPPKYLYVATPTVDLRVLPLDNAQIVRALKFHDKVESIAQSGHDWLKVRYAETGAQGWVRVLSLTESPAATPKVVSPPRKKLPKKSRPLKPAAPETPQEDAEPEVM
jgi:uncharacterized protein YgiM (DUF1202 family)